MRSFYSLTMILFVLFTLGEGDEWDMVHFPKIDILVDCLEASSVWSVIIDKENMEWQEDVIDYIMLELNQRSIWKGEMKAAVANMVQNLMENYDHQFIRLSRLEAEKTLAEALLQCSYQNDPIDRPSTSNDPKIHRLPYFGWEKSQFRDLLNLILVNWRCLPSQMLSTPYRIATLQSFVERAVELIESIYRTYGNDYDLDEELMLTFSCRSVFFFDFDDELDPYVDETYSLGRNEPYTQGDIGKYLKRIALGSNPDLPRSYIKKLLRIHPRDPHSSGLVYDYYSQYDEGIDAVNYILETKKTSFARIVLAILELLKSLTLTYGDDSVQDDEIVSRIPEKVIKILSDDDYYARYLLKKKWVELLRNPKDNAHVKFLKNNLRVREFPLIILIWKSIENQIKRVTTTTTTSTTTTTISSSTTESSSSEYEESERGKGHFKRIGNKCYPMNGRISNNENSSPNSIEGSKYSQRSKMMNNQPYGYLTSESYDGDLKDTFSSIVENEMGILELSSCY